MVSLKTTNNKQTFPALTRVLAFTDWIIYSHRNAANDLSGTPSALSDTVTGLSGTMTGVYSTVHGLSGIKSGLSRTLSGVSTLTKCFEKRKITFFNI